MDTRSTCAILASLLFICLLMSTLRIRERRPEVFAFVLTEGAPTWPLFDWSKLTTVALVGPVDSALVAFAQASGARVVATVAPNRDQLMSPELRRQWIESQLALVDNNNLDGLNVDFEEPLAKGAEADAYTALLSELREAMPEAHLSVDVAWSPDCTDGRCYDVVAMAHFADLLFVMSYDEQSQMWDTSDCVAMANSPLGKTAFGLDSYLELGIEPQKMVLGVPWYGYVYPCISFEGNKCHIQSVPFRGCNCSDAAGKEYSYSDVLSRLHAFNASLEWDESSASPFFSYEDGGRWTQVWFDDPRSLGLKYDLAASRGLAGVGFWTANFLDYDDAKQVAEMWGTVP